MNTNTNKSHKEIYDTVVYAIGRSADMPGLNLAAAGLKANALGKFVTDQGVIILLIHLCICLFVIIILLDLFVCVPLAASAETPGLNLAAVGLKANALGKFATEQRPWWWVCEWRRRGGRGRRGSAVAGGAFAAAGAGGATGAMLVVLVQFCICCCCWCCCCCCS